jgi:adenylate kinase
MIVSLTGTPGTGKTSVSEHLSGFEVIDLTGFVKEYGLGDSSGSEFEVDINEMKQKLDEEIDKDKDILIEGHLSHHSPADYCVVLRCDPEELEQRLEKRDYDEEKIQENVESEMLDVILTEAAGLQENIIEVDTTGREPEEVAEEIEKRIENEETGYGEVDWTGRL